MPFVRNKRLFVHKSKKCLGIQLIFNSMFRFLIIVLINFVLFSSLYGARDSTVFFEVLEEGVFKKNILSISSYGNHNLAFLFQDLDQKKVLVKRFNRYEEFEINGAVNHIYFEDLDNLLLLNNGKILYQWSLLNNELSERNDSLYVENSAHSFPKNAFSADGYINQSNLLFNPKESQWYAFYNHKIYRESRGVNSYFDYVTVNLPQFAQSRFAKRIKNNSWIIGFDRARSIYVVEKDSTFNIFDLPVNEELKKKRLFFYQMALRGNSIYLTGNDFKIYKANLSDYAIHVLKEHPNIRFKNIEEDSRGNIVVGSKEGDVFLIDQLDVITKIIDQRTTLKSDTYRFFEDREGWQWWGFSNGLCVYVPERKKTFCFNGYCSALFANESVSAFAILGKDFYIGTYDLGLFKTDYKELKKSIFKSLTNGQMDCDSIDFLPVQGFADYNIRDIQYLMSIEDKYLMIRTYERLWMLYDSGIFRITPNQGFRSYMSNFFSETLDNGITHSMENGVCIFYPNDYVKGKTENDLYISEVYMGHQNMDFSQVKDFVDLGEISETYSFIQLKVKSTYSEAYDANLEFSSDGKNWQESFGDFVVVANRSIGEHKIKIRSKMDGGYAKPLEVRFEVYREWYNLLWFQLLVAVLVVGVIIYLVWLNVRRKSTERKLKLVKLESLRSYMNPHFISNSLNAVNYYVLRNDKDTASKYLVKFSKLMRKTLHYASSEFISLKEEMNGLTNYIEIEQMRFKDKFEYQVKLDDNVNLEDRFASFILQPLVENAIWHGLVQKTENGNLLIEIKRIENQYHIQIKDDGIGIEASRALKSKSAQKRKSFGIDMIRHRLELLNEIYDYNQKIELVSLNDKKGTIVNVFLNIH